MASAQEQMLSPSTVLSGTVDALGRAAASDEVLTTEGVARYCELLGSLASAAVREGLAGLHDVCVVFQDILSRGQAGGPELTEEELERLRAWPVLVGAYVAAPHDPEIIDGLLAGLQGPRWRSELAEDAVEMLKAQLAAPSLGVDDDPVRGDTAPLPAHVDATGEGPAVPPVDGLPLDLEGDALALLLEADAEADAEAEAYDAPHSGDPSMALASALTNVPGLGERADAEDGAWLGHCAEQVAGVAEAAVQAGYGGLHEISLLFQAALLELQERGEELNADQRRAVERWPELVQGYLAAPTTGEALVDHLRNLDAGTDLSADDVQMLCALLDMGAGETDEGPVRDTVADIADVLDGANADTAVQAGGGGTEFGELPEAVRELVEILLGELPQMETSIAMLQAIRGNAGGEEETRHALQRYAKQLDRYGGAAETVGFAGLRQVCLYTRDNVLAIAEAGRDITDAELGLLQDWVGHVRNYLQMPQTASVGQALAAFLAGADWPQALSPEASQALTTLLGALDLESVVDEGESRQAHVTPEDVSLALPDDVDQALLDGMLQELPGQTEAFSAAIQRLTMGGSPEDVDIAQRIAHTLKGAGNTVGIRGIAHLTHQIEDILLACAKQKALPTLRLAESLMRAADCLEAMSETLQGAGSPPQDAPAVLQDILDWANRIDRDGIPREDDTQILGQPATQRLERDPGESPRTSGVAPERGPAAVTPTMRVPAGLVDELLRLVGETIILTGQVHERLRRTAKQAQAMKSTFNVLQQLGQELEEVIDVKDLSSKQQRQDSQFDPLELDQYNEIHTYGRRLVEAATDAREMGLTVIDYLAQLDDMLVSQERLNRESQESVLHTRMVPAKSLFPRLQRSVRQTCRLTGKQAELTTLGGETMMDSEVLNGILDPLMHVLRNAIDHGIESTEGRSAAGKDPLGKITLDFLREGNNILVRCLDDGAGLDFEAIRRSAEERGILNPDLEASQEELKRLILKPNFSTRSQATQTSGRGIGLDAVYARTMELGGSLTVQSEAGDGCAVELRLPLSLISSHALLVRVGQQVVAVANRGVEQIVAPGTGNLRPFGDDLIFHAGEDTHPARSLESMLQVTTDHAEGDLENRPVLLVQGETGLIAVLVEAVLDSRDLVVKGLGDYIPKLRGILGATILGDGSVTPVLDLSELLRTPLRARAADRPDTEQVGQDTRSLPIALVVDDSLSARRSLAQFMEDSGFVVRTARDGVEAVQMIESLSPDIVLADLEMPRMNGMELTSHIRAQESTAALPVIMVTSRSTDKHRRQAQEAGVNVYLTKPFSEDELLAHVHALQEKR